MLASRVIRLLNATTRGVFALLVLLFVSSSADASCGDYLMIGHGHHSRMARFGDSGSDLNRHRMTNELEKFGVLTAVFDRYQDGTPRCQGAECRANGNIPATPSPLIVEPVRNDFATVKTDAHAVVCSSVFTEPCDELAKGRRQVLGVFRPPRSA